MTITLMSDKLGKAMQCPKGNEEETKRTRRVMAKTKYERKLQLKQQRLEMQQQAQIQVHAVEKAMAVAETVQEALVSVDLDEDLRGRDGSTGKEAAVNKQSNARKETKHCVTVAGRDDGILAEDDELEEGEVRDKSGTQKAPERATGGGEATKDLTAGDERERIVQEASQAASAEAIEVAIDKGDIDDSDAEDSVPGGSTESAGSKEASVDAQTEPNPEQSGESTAATQFDCSDQEDLPVAVDVNKFTDKRLHHLEAQLASAQRCIDILQTENSMWKEAADKQQNRRTALLEMQVSCRAQARKLDRLIEAFENPADDSTDMSEIAMTTLREISAALNPVQMYASSRCAVAPLSSRLVFPARRGSTGRESANGPGAWREDHDLTDEYAIRIFTLFGNSSEIQQTDPAAVAKATNVCATALKRVCSSVPVGLAELLQHDVLVDEDDPTCTPSTPKRRRLRQRGNPSTERSVQPLMSDPTDFEPLPRAGSAFEDIFLSVSM